MKTLFYNEGPLIMAFGAAGIFRINEPREVEDDHAAILVKKGRLKEWPGEEPKMASKARVKED